MDCIELCGEQITFCLVARVMFLIYLILVKLIENLFVIYEDILTYQDNNSDEINKQFVSK